MSHIKIEDLNLDKLKISKSGKTVTLRYDNLPLQLATCKLYSPFGVKGKNSDYSPFTNWTIDCSVCKTNQFDTSLLDNKIIGLIKESPDLFNARHMDDVDLNSDFFSPIFKNNKTWPKLMKISLPRDTKGNILSVVFNENTEKIPVTDTCIEKILCKGQIFKAIIEFSKFWIFQGRIGTTWNLVQMKLVKISNEQDPEDKEAPDANMYTNKLMLDDD